MKSRLITTLAVDSLLALTACSSPQEAPAATPEPSSASLATTTQEAPQKESMDTTAEFGFISAMGTTGMFTFDTAPDPEVEAIREHVGVEPLTYLTVDVDNRDGGEFANMYAITGCDADGKKYEFNSISSFFDEWMEDLGTDDVTFYNHFVDVSNSQTYGVDVGERNTLTLAHAGPIPAEFTRVMVQAHGQDEGVDAFTDDTAPNN